jgi:D-tyrosyl-tRNA(Tyr) deacylase
MKMWPDENGSNWKKSVQEIDGEVLCVSQFTLYASTKKGNKPDFHGAAGGEAARELYEYFFSRVQALYNPAKVKDGVFQAMMQVSLVNDGPVRVPWRLTWCTRTWTDTLTFKVTLEIDTESKRSSAADTPTSSGIATPTTSAS